MSGTSADGIDIALTKISGAPPALNAKLLNHTSVDFPPQVRKEILRIAEQTPVSAGELSQLNFRLGAIYAEAALTACTRFRVSPSKVAILGNHGQTIFHQGPPVRYLGRPTASTLQIGDGSVIAAHTGITTVSDFRPADIALGGQGAPLVPYADYLLYRHPELGRVSLNLGGIANITVLPAGCKPSQVFAFDTGPANILIDALVQHFTRGRERFDKDGQRARQGKVNEKLTSHLLRDPYIYQRPPKSTGREYYGAKFVKEVLAAGKRYKARPNDIIRAATVFTIATIRIALEWFVLPNNKINQLIVSGGGAKNSLIFSILSDFYKANGIEVVHSSELGIPTEAKEAFAFALMAYETFHRRPSNLPSATGAKGPAILGKISYASPR